MLNDFIYIENEPYQNCLVAMLPIPNQLSDEDKSLLVSKRFDQYFLGVENGKHHHVYVLSFDGVAQGQYAIFPNTSNGFIDAYNYPEKVKLDYAANTTSNLKVVGATDTALGTPTLSENFLRLFCDSKASIKEVLVKFSERYEIGHNDVWVPATKEKYLTVDDMGCEARNLSKPMVDSKGNLIIKVKNAGDNALIQVGETLANSLITGATLIEITKEEAEIIFHGLMQKTALTAADRSLFIKIKPILVKYSTKHLQSFIPKFEARLVDHLDV